MPQKILRFTEDETAARAEVTRAGGRIVHQFSSTAFVVELPDSADLNALTQSTAEPTAPLDEMTELAVNAWRSREARGERAASPTEGLPWDTPGYEPPLEFGTPARAEAAVAMDDVEESTGTPTSLYMVGSVAVGLVMVSRNTGAEVLSGAEQATIVSEVQEGLDWLAGVEARARVSFAYDIHHVTVSAAPGPYAGVADPYERFERDWRDAALAALGYPAGRAGYQQYARDLRANRRTDWAYVAFFTRYPLNHFAYAIVEKVVMHYENDGWGPLDINRVFAHETCHIFGAADEYGSCSCASTHGHLRERNGNCVNCFPPGVQVPCLMNANTLAMCNFTRRQIGWDPALWLGQPKNAGGSSLYQLHRGGRIWRYTGTPCSGESCPGWQMVDNNPATAAIATGGAQLYQLHIDGRIWRYTGVPCTGESCPGWQLLDSNPNTLAIAADGDSHLYQLHGDGRIWRFTGSGWQMLDNNPATMAIAAGGNELYQLHRDGRIWRHTGVPCTGESCPGWEMLDNNPATIGIAAGGGQLYQLHRDGRIWRHTGVPCTGESCPGWEMLDNNPATVSIAADSDGSLYQLHASGRIWRYTGTPCSGESCPGWQMLDNNPATVAIAAGGGQLFQKHRDGRIWQYTGTPCTGESCPGWRMLDNNPATDALSSGSARR
jgi:Tectonin domain